MTPDRLPLLPRCSDAALLAGLGTRAVVLVGMMGAGKSSVGRRLALRLGLPFVDADAEIEAAAAMSIPDIFAVHGEGAFRSGEARVIARLLDGGPQVLATGGGAFMHPDTRAAARRKGISVWLKAEHEILMQRLRRRNDRPLLHTADPAATVSRLMEERHPVYAQADLTVESRDAPHSAVVDEVVAALVRHLVRPPDVERAPASGAEPPPASGAESAPAAARAGVAVPRL